MNLKFKQAVDQFAGRTLCGILRIPTWLLELVLRRKHTLPLKNPPKRIVVAKYIGIGSILQAMPLVKSLTEKYPSAEMVVLTVKSNEKLLSRYDFIDTIICVDDSSFFRLIASSISITLGFIRNKADIFFDLEVYSTYGSLMCLCSCALNRVGFSIQETDYKYFMYTHMLYMNTNFPIRHCYYQLGKIAGTKNTNHLELISPQLTDAELQEVDRQTAELFPGEHKGIIAVNPNASALRLERRWPKDRFAELGAELVKRGYAVAFVGAKSEREYVQEIIDSATGDKTLMKNVAGDFSLLNFFGFLDRCSLVVTNDSGVMNMALTLDVPQLLLAGPVDPEQYFIPGDRRTYIYHQTYCSPCTHYIDVPPCLGDNVCMQKILTSEAVDAAEKLLNNGVVAPRKEVVFSSSGGDTLGIIKDMGSNNETI